MSRDAGLTTADRACYELNTQLQHADVTPCDAVAGFEVMHPRHVSQMPGSPCMDSAAVGPRLRRGSPRSGAVYKLTVFFVRAAYTLVCVTASPQNGHICSSGFKESVILVMLKSLCR